MLFLALSGLATGLSWLCYFRALQLGPASRVAPLDKLSVPLVMIFAWLLLGEKLNAMALVGGVLITAGAVVMVMAEREQGVVHCSLSTVRAWRSYTGTNDGRAPTTTAARFRAAAHCAHRLYGFGQDHRRPAAGPAAGLELCGCGRRDRSRGRLHDSRALSAGWRSSIPRARARRHCAAWRDGDGLVLALGGGAIEDAATRSLLLNAPDTLLVHLEVELATTLARCRGTEHLRPVLADQANLASRYERRLPLYRTAHVSIAVDALTPQQVVEAIVRSGGLGREAAPRASAS